LSLEDDWASIENRVRGLQATATVFFQALPGFGDYHGVSSTALIPLARRIHTDLRSFRDKYSGRLPPSVAKELDEFLDNNRKIFESASGIPGVGATTVALASISATVSALLADREARARSITERALAHLQRQIVADPAVRATWQAAATAGEVECERLGATHLLLHGIWAFKVSATGERTDLVFGEPLELGEAERASPSALVLTEWKVASTDNDAEAKVDEAGRQAALYAAGSLSDLELTSVRYLIVVTPTRRDMGNQTTDGGIVYRQVLLAVDPATPSVVSRQSRGQP
jgi:hypothetical protein